MMIKDPANSATSNVPCGTLLVLSYNRVSIIGIIGHCIMLFQILHMMLSCLFKDKVSIRGNVIAFCFFKY